MISLRTIQTEIDASFLYQVLAEHEEDENVAKVFKQMSEIEMSHALAFLKKNKLGAESLPGPSSRAKILRSIGKLFGYDMILGVLLDTEKSISSSILNMRRKNNLETSISNTAHVTILKNILDHNPNVSGSNLARFEKRHRSVGGNALRAAVLGGNDGLVSNFSLVMGVAGATSGRSEVLLAGMAGLLAGALSMSLGEWISVKSYMKTRWSLRWKSLNTIPKAKKKNWHLFIFQKEFLKRKRDKWPQM